MIPLVLDEPVRSHIEIRRESTNDVVYGAQSDLHVKHIVIRNETKVKVKDHLECTTHQVLLETLE